MTEIKHIDIAEFRDLGFLQEANREWFHPHGLALEVEIVPKSGLLSPEEPALRAITEVLARYVRGNELMAAAYEVANVVYPPGSVRLSGVWDYRDDPEGVTFGDLTEEDGSRAFANVRPERERHFEARCALFGADRDPPLRRRPMIPTSGDVQPFDWKPKP